MRSRDDFTDPQRLREQYGDAERFQTRVETHRLYGERKVSFPDWTIALLDVRAGQLVADIGCGPGNYVAPLLGAGARVVGCDLSIGMATEAVARGGAAVVADAQHLPFVSASADRVMCNHVLYHVPDQQAAMFEMRRVCRPGGRVLISTNGSDHLAAFRDLTRLAAADLGFDLAPRPRSPFTLEDVSRVREVFPTAEVHRLEDTLVFHEAEPAIAYLRTWIGPTGPLEDAMRRRIDGAIHMDGAFRVPTVAGCFVATVEGLR